MSELDLKALKRRPGTVYPREVLQLIDALEAERSARLKAEAAAAEMGVVLTALVGGSNDCVPNEDGYCEEHLDYLPCDVGRGQAALASDAGTALLAVLKGLYERLEEETDHHRLDVDGNIVECGEGDGKCDSCLALDAAKPWLARGEERETGCLSTVFR